MTSLRRYDDFPTVSEMAQALSQPAFAGPLSAGEPGSVAVSRIEEVPPGFTIPLIELVHARALRAGAEPHHSVTERGDDKVSARYRVPLHSPSLTLPEAASSRSSGDDDCSEKERVMRREQLICDTGRLPGPPGPESPLRTRPSPPAVSSSRRRQAAEEVRGRGGRTCEAAPREDLADVRQAVREGPVDHVPEPRRARGKVRIGHLFETE